MNSEVKKLIRKLNGMPYVGTVLVGINVIVFLICTFTGELLYNKGDVSALNLFRGEYYRMITSMFLHVGTSHLVNNMLLLFGLGVMLEKELGHVRFGIYYMITGLCGNLLSAAWEVMTGDYVSSVGASGAVFGMVGVLLALVLFSGRTIENVTLPRLLLMIGFSLYSGFTAENVDNAAHVGGLLSGIVLGVCLCMIRRMKYGRRLAREGQKEKDEY